MVATLEDVKVTIVVDNVSLNELKTEHGLSLYLETPKSRVLFDTGQGSTVVENAEALNIDLTRLNMLVLSHGHYDHTGGVADVLRLAKKAKLYSHPGIIHPRYSIRHEVAKTIQLPEKSLAAISKLSNERLHWIQQPVRLNDQFGLTGPIDRLTNFEGTGGPFFLDPNGIRADIVHDDLALWVQTKKGLVICVGCAHAGIINTLWQIQNQNFGQKFYAVIGGLHLNQACSKQLALTMDALKKLDAKLYVPCHCTGVHATTELQRHFGARVTPGAAGMTFNF